MGLRINTNVASITAQRNLQANSTRLQGHFAKLASGLRIATAADDASGLGISERMRAEIRSHSVAARNIQDGISLTQVAEGALQEVSNLFGRMRELATRAQTGTLSDSDRSTLNDEFVALASEVNRITSQTEFNGVSLFSSTTDLRIQSGASESDFIDIGLTQLTTLGTVLQGFPLSGPLGPNVPAELLSSLIDTVSGVRGDIGAVTNRLQSALASSFNVREQLSAAESRIRDTDIAHQTALLAKDTILQQAASSVLTQANASPQLALQLLR